MVRTGRPPRSDQSRQTGQLLILEALSKQGLQSAYALSSRSRHGVKLDYHAVSYNLNKLAKRKLVRVTSRPEKLGRGKEVIYQATVSGLLHLLLRRTLDRSTMIQIAQKFKDLFPFVFGLWDYFSEKGVDMTLLKVIREVAIACRSSELLPAAELFHREHSLQHEPDWRSLVARIVTGEIRPITPESRSEDEMIASIVEPKILIAALTWFQSSRADESVSVDERTRLAEALVSNDRLVQGILHAIWDERQSELERTLATESDEDLISGLRQRLHLNVLDRLPHAAELLNHIQHKWAEACPNSQLLEIDLDIGPFFTPQDVRSCPLCRSVRQGEQAREESIDRMS